MSDVRDVIYENLIKFAFLINLSEMYNLDQNITEKGQNFIFVLLKFLGSPAKPYLSKECFH